MTAFRTGLVNVGIIAHQLVNDSSLCSSILLHADADNTGRISIGHNNQVSFEVAAANATATLETGDGELTITAAANGLDWNDKTIVFSLQNVAAASPNATYVNDTITINVNSTVNTTTANINTALNGLTAWDSNEANAGNFTPGDAGLTATLANGANAVVANGVLTTNDGVVTITATEAGVAWNGKSIVFALDANTPEGTPTAAYANDTLTITVNSGANTTTANIVTAVNTTSNWTAVETNAGNFEPSVDDSVNATTSNGVNAISANTTVTLGDAGEFTITAAATGTTWNGKTVAFVLSTSTTANAPTAVYASNTITITVNSTVNTPTANIVSVVTALTNWNATEDTPGEFSPGDAGIVVVTSGGYPLIARNGYELEAKEELKIEVDMLSKIYVIASNSSQYLSWRTIGN